MLATTGTFAPADWVVLGAYLAAMVAVGAWASRREQTTDDYFLAGRRIPGWAAGLSIFGTGLSAITYMSIPAKAYAGNWAMILTSLVAVGIIPFVVRWYIPFYRRLRVTTAYEYLQRRFNLPARWFGSLYYMLFQFGRMAIVLYLPAQALATVTGLDLTASILLMGLLATVYTVLGGIEAVIWTDVAQVVVLLGGAVVCLAVVCLRTDGGLAAILQAGQQAGKFHVFQWRGGPSTAAVWVMLLGGFFSQVMPNTADQSIVQRYLVTPHERSAVRAAWTSALMGIPTAFLFFFLGTALYVFYQVQHPHLVPAGMKSIAVLPLFVMQQLPPGLSGLIIAGIFAASMSSVDSGINGVATAVTTDFYRLARPHGTAREYLRVARIVTLAAGVVGTALALGIPHLGVESLLDLFFEVMGLFGGSLAGLFVLGIFTRRSHGSGALVGAVASAAVLSQFWANSAPAAQVAALRLPHVAWEPLKVHGLLYAPIGLAVCVGVGYLASLLLPARRKELAGLTLYTMPPREDTTPPPAQVPSLPAAPAPTAPGSRRGPG